jgi:hypothetical protein
MSAKTGTLYFLENFSSLNTGNYILHYRFNGLDAGLNVPNSSPYSEYEDFYLKVISGSSFSFVPPGGSGFFHKSGYGFFTGSRILQVNNFGSGFDYEFNGFGFSFVASGKGVIFSNIEKDFYKNATIYKGFSFGINDANRLYFENRSDNNLYSYVLDEPLGENNCLFVSYSNGNLSLGKQNFFSQGVVSKDFFLEAPILTGSKSWNIGGITGNSNNFYNKNFSGYLDEFLFFSEPVDQFNSSLLASGFIYEPVTSGFISGYVTGYEITGYNSIYTGISSGITGYTINPTGLVEDEFGNKYTGYTEEPIYYIESGIIQVPISGEVVYPIFTGLSTELVFDESYYSSFGMSKGVSVYNLDTGNVFSWTYESNTGEFLNTFANSQSYYPSLDRINLGFFLNNTNSNFVFYLNGIMQNSGSGYYSGDFYDQKIVLERDYFTSGKFIYSTGGYSLGDEAYVEYLDFSEIEIIDNFSHVSGTGNRFICSGTNNLVFFNGQKLNTGIFNLINENYIYVINNNLFFNNYISLFEGVSGTLSIVKNIKTKRKEFNSYSGFFNIDLLGGKYKESSLSCFLNGVKLDKNIDYFESSSNDLFVKNGSFSSQKSVLYNNNGSFFEN